MTLYAPIELPLTTPNVLWIKKCQQSKKFSRNLQKCSRGTPEIEHRAAWSDDPVLFLYLHQLPAPKPPNLRLFIQPKPQTVYIFTTKTHHLHQISPCREIQSIYLESRASHKFEAACLAVEEICGSSTHWNHLSPASTRGNISLCLSHHCDDFHVHEVTINSARSTKWR